MDPEKKARLEAAGYQFTTVGEWLGMSEDHRREFSEQMNADYAALRADPAAWEAYQRELALWGATLADGLEEE